MNTYAHEYRISGSAFDQDHGYALLSALTRIAPHIHGRHDIQIAPLRGTRSKDSKHLLHPDRNTWLHIRGMSDEEAAVLAHKSIVLDGSLLTINELRTRHYTPVERLASQRVIFTEKEIHPEAFREKLLSEIRRVTKSDVNPTIQVGRTRALAIKRGRKLLGHSVELSDLDEATSIILQQKGIGRCTSMCSGVFAPFRPRTA